jgi:hypothetical protein
LGYLVVVMLLGEEPSKASSNLNVRGQCFVRQRQWSVIIETRSPWSETFRESRETLEMDMDR